MQPTVIRRNDLFDLRRQEKQASTIAAVIVIVATLAHVLAFAGSLIWKGGLIGFGVVLVLALVTAIWVWADDAFAKSRMRKRLRAATAQPETSSADRSRPKIDAWLLVNGSLGIGIHDQSQNLYVFKGKRVFDPLNAKELGRVEARRKRRRFGGWQDILFLSDEYAGPGLELRVTEGNLRDFLRHVDRKSLHQGQGRDALTLAAKA